jgi:hypothetical protein
MTLDREHGKCELRGKTVSITETKVTRTGQKPLLGSLSRQQKMITSYWSGARGIDELSQGRRGYRYVE